MSLITRCPACGTKFKVVTDQLKVSEGWVRCGQCAEVFVGTLHMQASHTRTQDLSLEDSITEPLADFSDVTEGAKIASDLSGLTNTLENGKANNLLGGMGSGIAYAGGNTFLLVTQLYQNEVINVLAKVVENGTPYLGSSAGSNITGLTMQTTNDMPIIYPPSFKTLGLIPFNLNPHYLDADLQTKHMGETRETRIKEFHAFNTTPVLGLREGSWLEVSGSTILLKGDLTALLFRQNEAPEEVTTGTNLEFLN